MIFSTDFKSSMRLFIENSRLKPAPGLIFSSFGMMLSKENTLPNWK